MKRPNVVLVVLDDCGAQEVAGSMPYLTSLMAREGAEYANAFTPYPLCTPSRSSLHTGQYAHNHKVLTNAGGETRFRATGAEARSFARYLHRAGYHCGMRTRYMNAVGAGQAGSQDPTRVPPGWDDWHCWIENPIRETPAKINVNGRVSNMSPRHPDAMTGERVKGAILSYPEPFFLWAGLTGPHVPVRIPDSYLARHADDELPSKESIGEDVSDKPAWVRNMPEPATETVRQNWARRRGACRYIDDVVIRPLFRALRDRGILNNTLVVVTSDNGYQFGEHRLGAKRTPYDEALRVPFYVRGPGVGKGVTCDQFVLNNDVAPTILRAAGVAVPGHVDGRDVLGYSRPWENPGRGRNSFVIKNTWEPKRSRPPSYRGIRTRNRKYVRYANGEVELYDLEADPLELESRHADPAFAEEKASLAARLEELEGSSGAGCRQVENRPLN